MENVLHPIEFIRGDRILTFMAYVRFLDKERSALSA